MLSVPQAITEMSEKRYFFHGQTPYDAFAFAENASSR